MLYADFRESALLDDKLCDFIYTFAARQIRKNERLLYAHPGRVSGRLADDARLDVTTQRGGILPPLLCRQRLLG